MTERILVAGVGNIFLGDDGFGVEAARLLAQQELPPEVRLVDFGIRGLDLAYALLDLWDAVILIDALPRGGEPGAVYLIEPDLHAIRSAANAPAAIDAHGMDPLKVLRLALTMTDSIAPVYIVGCEPGDFGDELEGRMGLSPAIQAAVPEAARMAQALIGKILAQQEAHSTLETPQEVQS